mgnify:CR=1 FL=1
MLPRLHSATATPCGRRKYAARSGCRETVQIEGSAPGSKSIFQDGQENWLAEHRSYEPVSSLGWSQDLWFTEEKPERVTIWRSDQGRKEKDWSKSLQKCAGRCQNGPRQIRRIQRSLEDINRSINIYCSLKSHGAGHSPSRPLQARTTLDWVVCTGCKLE